MDDLISRRAAIDVINKEQKEIDVSDVSAMYAYSKCKAIIKQLPSAQPKRGKWIYHIDDLFPAESTMECDRCHEEQLLTCDDNFCPHCGAKMKVTE